MESPPRRLVAPRVCRSDYGREPCGAAKVLDEFRKSPPGRRFQRHHRRRRGRSGGRLWRYTVFAAGGLLCAVGLFFMAVPGPGIPILLAGAALIAGESFGMARLLDRTELRLRRMFRR